ncbi:MAG: hypothetical protein IPK16_17675 [Anaerolineales bacterium]|nr:hypothetical protein [Anaerolineales bacterium]
MRRASWLEIAEALQGTGRMATVLLSRLQAAKNREDALRVLRIARKRTGNLHKGGSAKGKSSRHSKAIELQGQLQYENIANDTENLFYPDDFDFEYYDDFLGIAGSAIWQRLSTPGVSTGFSSSGYGVGSGVASGAAGA